MRSMKTTFTAHNKQLKQQEIHFSSLNNIVCTLTHTQTQTHLKETTEIRLSKTTTLDCIRKSCYYSNNRLLLQTVQSVFTSVRTT